MLGRVYAYGTRLRRSWYGRHPEARRRLVQPAISIGNLSAGGSGKTPLVACVVRLLLEMGERPAVLSRGYGRRSRDPAVVVVRDAHRMRADLARAGDEPLMLARSLPGAAVVVAADRYSAGRVAEADLGCSVHVLDDGFQHLQLLRDVDLLVVSEHDLAERETFPRGRLREPLETAAEADALVLTFDEAPAATPLPAQPRRFRGRRSSGVPRLVQPFGDVFESVSQRRAFAIAGIARPHRFFDDLRMAGWDLAGCRTYPDHHRYSPSDVVWIAGAAHRVGADVVVTTEKDLMRLLPFRPLPFVLVWVPLLMAVEQAEEFRTWIAERMSSVRQARAAGPTGSGASSRSC